MAKMISRIRIGWPVGYVAVPIAFVLFKIGLPSMAQSVINTAIEWFCWFEDEK